MMISFSEFVDEIVSEAASDEMVFQVASEEVLSFD